MADSIACCFCRREIPGYVKGLSRHISWHIEQKDFHEKTSFFDCTFPRCNTRYQNFSSLKRHIVEHHPVISSIPSNAGQPLLEVAEAICNKSDEELPSTPSRRLDEIRKTAALSICRLTADTGLPQTKISDTVKICENITVQLTEYLLERTQDFLQVNGINLEEESTQGFLNNFRNLDLFKGVKTYSQQKSYLQNLAINIPMPESKCVGTRRTIRHVRGIPKMVTTNETFSYIPIIQTLKLIFRDTQNRELLKTDENFFETPGIKEYSSFESGILFDRSEYLKLYPDAVRLILYQDDVEISNALSSRAGKHKISNFSFKVKMCKI